MHNVFLLFFQTVASRSEEPGNPGSSDSAQGAGCRTSTFLISIGTSLLLVLDDVGIEQGTRFFLSSQSRAELSRACPSRSYLDLKFRAFSFVLLVFRAFTFWLLVFHACASNYVYLQPGQDS
jgi:hypothetical protein